MYWLARVPPASVSPSSPASFLSGRIAIRLPPDCTQFVSRATSGSDSVEEARITTLWPASAAALTGPGVTSNSLSPSARRISA
jgi:hypothetical protein